jgi:ribonuclease P protein component
MLKSNQRLRRNSEYLFLKSHGSQFITPYFKLIYRNNAQAETSRVGIIVGNYIGGAVKRNRVKRRIREVFRKNILEIRQKTDLICLVRPQVLSLSFGQLQNEISRALQNAGLISVKS